MRQRAVAVRGVSRLGVFRGSGSLAPGKLPGELDLVDFNRLDIALLRIAPLPESPPLPAAMPLELTTERSDGSLISIVLYR